VRYPSSDEHVVVEMALDLGLELLADDLLLHLGVNREEALGFSDRVRLSDDLHERSAIDDELVGIELAHAVQRHDRRDPPRPDPVVWDEARDDHDRPPAYPNMRHDRGRVGLAEPHGEHDLAGRAVARDPADSPEPVGHHGLRRALEAQPGCDARGQPVRVDLPALAHLGSDLETELLRAVNVKPRLAVGTGPLGHDLDVPVVTTRARGGQAAGGPADHAELLEDLE